MTLFVPPDPFRASFYNKVGLKILVFSCKDNRVKKMKIKVKAISSIR